MEVGGIEETVTVTAESPLVDLTSKEIGGNITSETLVQAAERQRQLHRLRRPAARHRPVDQHRVVRQRLDRVNGQDPRNNNYMLDGGNNNDDVIGQRAGTQARTPIEAIQEFQVITGQYDARVRPHVRRRRQRGDQVGHQQLQRQRVRLLPGRAA